ncbi:hypothetical protein [Sphingobacterium multivorum]|uniref:hypothetical protein n=1 Tax=Sphingobacterium multivorum TaxID=28454 RepID=UPI003682F2A1
MANKELEFKLENGDRLRVEISFHFDSFRYNYEDKKGFGYSSYVTYIEKGKRKGVKVDENLYISQVQYTALELWKELMPTFDNK